MVIYQKTSYYLKKLYEIFTLLIETMLLVLKRLMKTNKICIESLGIMETKMVTLYLISFEIIITKINQIRLHLLY